MTQEKQREKLERMLQKCPDVLTPLKASRWAPIGKNAIYAAVKSGEIESFRYKGGYILTKDALIDYIVKTANGKGKLHYMLGEKNDK